MIDATPAAESVVDVASDTSNPSPRRGTVWVQAAALGLLCLSGLAAWSLGIAHGAYDYDEVQRAHSVWLAGQGLRPYTDFFECHPPYFVLLAPVARMAPDACSSLLALRLCAALGNLAFLTGLIAVGATLPGRGRFWATAGVMLVAFHQKVLDFLIDFRIDGWGYALVAWSLARFRRDRPGVWRFVEFGAFSALASGLFCPKIVLLPPLVVACELALARQPIRARIRAGTGYAAGIGIAFGAFLLYLALNGIGLGPTVQFLTRYHAMSNAHTAYRLGLLHNVEGAPSLLLPMIAGALAWLVDAVRRKSRPDAYLIALFVWLVAQALLVNYPYRQYSAPWFLFGSGFVVTLGRLIDAYSKRLGVAVLCIACGYMAFDVLPSRRIWFGGGIGPSQRAELRLLGKIAEPDDRVVAAPPYHPIDRRDAFFVWFSTTDPKGFDSERIMRALPALRPLVTASRFQQELAAHPPALAVLEADGLEPEYTNGQWRALRRFVKERNYRIVKTERMLLAVRPDRVRAVEALLESSKAPRTGSR